MDREEIEKFLVEQGVPEEKITEIADGFEQIGKERHEDMSKDPVEIAPGIYLSHLMKSEPDWKKRSVIAAKIISINLEN